MARFRSTIARLERALLARALRREIAIAKISAKRSAGLAAERATLDLARDADGVWR